MTASKYKFTVLHSEKPWILSSASFLTYCFNALFFWNLNLKVGWRAFVNQICNFSKISYWGLQQSSRKKSVSALELSSVRWRSSLVQPQWPMDHLEALRWLMWEDASLSGHDFQGWRLQTQSKLCSGLITPHQQQLDLKASANADAREPSTCPQDQNETQIKKIHVLALRLQSATGGHLALGCCLWLQRAFTWLQKRLDY